MTFEELQVLIDHYIDKLPSKNVKMHEAEDLAPQFLKLLNAIATVRLVLDNERIEAKSLEEVTYRDCIQRAEGKNVTEKKIDAVAMLEYQEGREAVERADAKIEYLKANTKIFENAHIFYRQVAKGNGS